jgi:hypothetical protein
MDDILKKASGWVDIIDGQQPQLLNEDMSAAEKHLQTAVFYTAKPNKWMYIRKVDFSSNDLNDESRSAIKKLKTYTTHDLYEKDGVKTLEDYAKNPKEMIFILKNDDNKRTYLVNNEGYTYNRYMVELVNMK